MEKRLNRDLVRENAEDSTVMEEPTESTQDDQPVSKRRTIRSHYRGIENRINEKKDEIAYGGSEKFIAIMNEVENIHQHVNKPSEQVADAEALFGLTRTLVASIKTHTSGGVTPAEFVSCLIREFGQQITTKELLEKSHAISWKTIGSCVSPIFMNGSGCMTMIGPMKNELKVRKLVARAKRPRSIRKARPQELEKAAEVSTDTDRNMHVMFEILKKEKKVKVENLMLNRNSFAQTVENLFALSFLIKDGRVCIDVDGSGSQVAVPRNGPNAEEIKSGVAKNHHFIFRFDFDDWKLMKASVPEGEELMTPRAGFTKGKAESGDKDSSPAKAIPSDSELICMAAPVKKFSRNYMAIPCRTLT